MNAVGRPILAIIFLAVMMLAVFVVAIPPPKADSGGEPICSLSKTQADESSQAFKALLPIFREARCLNCHGAINPFAKETTHGGGYIDIRHEAKEFLKNHPDLQEYMAKEHGSESIQAKSAAKDQARMEKLANSSTDVSDSDAARRDGFEVYKDICQGCHIAGWMIPMSENFFTGRDDDWFCPHMKESLGSAASFMAHVEKDELIQEGFKGTRGLNEEFGIPKAVEVRKQPYEPEPPGSMTYQQFKQRAKAWIDAMGGKFREPKECGCVPQKYKAKIGQRWDVKSNMGVIQSQLESEANFLIDLTFDTEGSFTGHMTVPRELAVHQTGLGTSCEGKGSWYQTWSISGIVNDNSGEMLMKLRFASSPQQGQMTCYTPAGPVTKPFSRPGFSSDSVSTPLAGFVMPAKVGAKQHFEWSLLGGRNTVDIELTKVTS